MGEAAVLASAMGGSPAGDVLRGRFVTALEQARQAAAAHAAGGIAERIEAVRRFRKSLKAARAVLPLLDRGTCYATLAANKSALSAASDLLAPVRDRDALQRTVARMYGVARRSHATGNRGILNMAIAMPGGDADMRTLEDLLMARAVAWVVRVVEALPEIHFEEIDADEVANVIGKRWRAARRLASTVFEKDDSEALHELRRRASRLALQFAAFPKAGRLQVLRKRLRGITSALGDEHDLSMLAERISVARPSFNGNHVFLATYLVVKKARGRLRDQAKAAATKAFRRSAGNVRRTVRAALP
jgi:CHAD domain-containing protein